MGTDEAVHRVIENATEALIEFNADLIAAETNFNTLSDEMADIVGQLAFIAAKTIDSTTKDGKKTLEKESDLNK